MWLTVRIIKKKKKKEATEGTNYSLFKGKANQHEAVPSQLKVGFHQLITTTASSIFIFLY